MYLPAVVSRIAVQKIIGDLSDRCGIGNEWENIDEDTQIEIEKKWRKIIEDSIETFYKP